MSFECSDCKGFKTIGHKCFGCERLDKWDSLHFEEQKNLFEYWRLIEEGRFDTQDKNHVALMRRCELGDYGLADFPLEAWRKKQVNFYHLL